MQRAHLPANLFTVLMAIGATSPATAQVGHTGTPLHETDDTFSIFVGPSDDVFAIKRSKTGSKSTEVHVLSAASTYQKYILQTGTALGESGAETDFAIASNRDLFIFPKSKTGSKKTEVHILSAESGYKKFTLQTGTALHETDASVSFAVAPNRDVFVFMRSKTGSKSTEVHVLSAESNYQKFSLQTGTGLHETDATFEFAVASNRDVFAFKRSKTGSKTTEVHVLSAASGYKSFVLQTGTALQETDNTVEFGVDDARNVFVFMKAKTGSKSTEVHVLSAAKGYKEFY